MQSLIKLFAVPVQQQPPVAAPVQRQRMGPRPPCPHALEEFSTPTALFQCDHCRQPVGPWKTMFGCRECNYDECAECYEFLHEAELKEEAPSLSNTPTCTIATGNSTKSIGTQDTTTELTCMICCDATCQVAFVECGHCISCSKCARSLMVMGNPLCPVCRVAITSRPLKVYFS